MILSNFVRLSCLLTACFLLACKGDKGDAGPAGPVGTTDKQIRLTFFSVLGIGRTDTVYYTLPNYLLVKFNKSNYTDVDSITFAAVGRSDSSNVFCTLELFNVTDSLRIQGSSIQTNSKVFKLFESNNIVSILPNKEIALAISIRSSKQGTLVEVQQAHLFVYRK